MPVVACWRQVSALGSPNLLERVSAHMAQHGDLCDRGGSSGWLRGEMQAVLAPEEAQALDRLLGRLHLLASRCRAKVSKPPVGLSSPLCAGAFYPHGPILGMAFSVCRVVLLGRARELWRVREMV